MLKKDIEKAKAVRSSSKQFEDSGTSFCHPHYLELALVALPWAKLAARQQDGADL